ncbi:nucleotidyl transferase AbiEii/AbiGii toxin family protein [Streptomyces sp. XD-27]|uniref:nucleotidyl transferase AbiEii/AbiGii toxin family protein n=1 Tax=Streptomyces sp. XD-27 TaxID=3062779 RepID=UPI0026F41460|nr:nucleotidyl transferase AbiEii/AbiGii toxin family protein [Streptomyces sp. XD-27]WKX72260.1 nucleotidyl transferase AbiEii/AbiGii toxin family protein [Streptomyces sp. XD-27]
MTSMESSESEAQVSAWRTFGWGPWGADETVPQEEPDEATRAALSLPATLRPVAGGDDDVVQRPVFDPSMTHYRKAMRLGEPEFADAETSGRWYAARRRALDLVLAAVADSEWADHLVLRGSVLLRAWFGEAAREPGDLDFVVEPATWRLADDRTDRMLASIARGADLAARRGGGPVRLDSRGAAGDEIWTYDRVPGRRLVLPWRAEGLPGGTVQLDFVFNEPLPAPTVHTAIPRSDGAGDPARLRAVTPELSLAWKIMWLATDIFPEGKDLYDAVLLAESGAAGLSFDLLRAVFRGVDDGFYDRNPVLPEDIVHSLSRTEWFEFAKEYPGLAGPARSTRDAPPTALVDRLVTALAPVYALDDGSGESARYQRYAAWLAPLTRECRGLPGGSGPDAVHEHLLEARVQAEPALVVTRELLGRGACDLDRAAALLAAYRSPTPTEYPWRRQWREEDLVAAATRLADGTR